MTNNKPKTNNLFNFATSELSQDAFFCWSLNWLAVKEDTDDPYYKYGKAMLDLFLGDNKKDEYTDVLIKKQFVVKQENDEINNSTKTDSTPNEKKRKNKGIIDILVLFKIDGKTHALIIEDKTHTSEHCDQIATYKKNLPPTLKKSNDAEIEPYKDLSSENIYTTYVKTGIMYSQDIFMKNTVNTIVDFDRLYSLLTSYSPESKEAITSDIFLDYYHYLGETKENYEEIEEMIEKNLYVEALKTEYGRYCFLKKIFYEENGKMDLNCKDKTDEADIYVETIKSENNNGKVPFAEYVIWHAKQNEKMAETDQQDEEYHSIFWRIDNATDNKTISPYLALRYYSKRKKNIFGDLKEYVTNKFIEKSKLKNKKIFSKKESRKGSAERNLLYIPIRNLDGISLTEISKVLHDINSKLTTYCKIEFENIK